MCFGQCWSLRQAISGTTFKNTLTPRIEVAMGGVPAVLLAFVFDKDAFYNRNDWIY